MIEVGLLLLDGSNPFYWHLPVGASAGSLPDSRELWDVLWENRKKFLSFAHTHPGSGNPFPSTTDLTTFAAVQAALGRPVFWWIATSDGFCSVTVDPWEPKNFNVVQLPTFTAPWLDRLRIVSRDWAEKGVWRYTCDSCGWQYVHLDGENSDNKYNAINEHHKTHEGEKDGQ